MSTKFPWDSVKANTLRLICHELGFKASPNRVEMTSFLETAALQGLEPALATTAVRPPTISSAASKRKAPEVSETNDVHEYNTRNRDGKKRRLSDPGPRKRKPTERAIAAKAAVARSPAKKRGRPRKSAPTSVTAHVDEIDSESSRSKTIFDGVVLPAKARRQSTRMNQEPADEGEQEEDSNKENEPSLATEPVIQPETTLATEPTVQPTNTDDV